jgi:glycosyltransferase involved in cell wall biosynthesis
VKRVSVVIPVRNGAATLGAQLEALARQEVSEPWEVVVADNGSTDGTAEVAESFRARLPELTVVRVDHGFGINIARNAGVSAARGDRILICDADDVVQPGWIAAHLEGLREYDLTGGALDEETLNTPEVARFNAGPPQAELPTSGGFLPYATGNNMAFHRKVWDAVQGFDEAWVRGATEIEFCWRAQLAGFSLGWVSAAVVAYRHGATLRSEVRRRYRSARAVPRLFAHFRKDGMPGTRTVRALRAWAWIGYRAPSALWGAGAARMKWLQVLAWRAGLVAGSIRYGVWYL